MKIYSFKHTYMSGYLNRKENSNKTSSNRNFSSSLKPITLLLFSCFQTLRHSRSLSPDKNESKYIFEISTNKKDVGFIFFSVKIAKNSTVHRITHV